MNLQSILGISLAGVSLACSIGFLMHKTGSPEPKPNILSPPSSYMEYMPESGDESYRLHVLNKDGVEDKIYIRYKDKSLGVVHLTNGKTTQKRRYFLDGSAREESEFDEDGVLLSGFEYRSDRTIIWQTTNSASQGKTFTRVFWPGGEVFLDREYELATKIASATFHREDGSLWQRSQYRGDELTLQMTYDENRRLRVMKKQPDKAAEQAAQSVLFAAGVPEPIYQVVYFDAAGKPDFGQWFAHSAMYYYDAAEGKPNPNSVMLIGVDVYGDGQLTTRFQLTMDQRIRVMDQFAADGAILRSYVQSKGMITRRDTITARGAMTQYDFQGRFGMAPPVDSRYLVTLSETDVPYRQFNERNARLSKEAQ